MNTRKFTLFSAFTRIHVSQNNCFALNWPRESAVRIYSGNVNGSLIHVTLASVENDWVESLIQAELCDRDCHTQTAMTVLVTSIRGVTFCVPAGKTLLDNVR